MLLLAIWAALHFNVSLPASIWRAFIDEPQQLSGKPTKHEARDCRAEHGHAMAGHTPAAENEIKV